MFDFLLILGLVYFLFVLHALGAMVNNIDSKKVPFLARFLFLFFTAPLVGFFFVLTSPISSCGQIVDLFDRMTMRSKFLDIQRKPEESDDDNVIEFRKH